MHDLMVIVVGNGHSNTSSNPEEGWFHFQISNPEEGWFHFHTHVLEKGMNLSTPSSYG